jgi:hypothetical protein
VTGHADWLAYVPRAAPVTTELTILHAYIIIRSIDHQGILESFILAVLNVLMYILVKPLSTHGLGKCNAIGVMSKCSIQLVKLYM